MVTKHFFKVFFVFILMIILGIVGVFLANYLDGKIGVNTSNDSKVAK